MKIATTKRRGGHRPRFHSVIRHFTASAHLILCPAQPHFAGHWAETPFQLIVCRGIQIGSDVFWLWWQSVGAALYRYREASIHVTSIKTGSLWASESCPFRFTNSGRTQFITRRLRCPFLVECRRDPRYFESQGVSRFLSCFPH